MRLGISGQALGEIMSFDEIVRIGLSYDVRDFEIWPVNATGSGWGYRKRDISSIKSIIDSEEIRVGCVTMGDAFDSGIINDPEGYADALCSAIEAAKILGASCVNHYCFHISMNEPDYRLMERYWAKPLALAEELNITLALENEAHDATATPDKMLVVLKHFDSPYFKTNFDATNYFHASCEGYPASYEVLKDYIGYVHLKNGCLYREGMPPENTGAPMSGYHEPAPIQYTPIPDGAVNIAGLLSRIIEDKSYDGLCTLEPHTKPEFVEAFYAREIAYLRRLGFFNLP